MNWWLLPDNVLDQIRESTNPDIGFYVETPVILDAIWRI